MTVRGSLWWCVGKQAMAVGWGAGEETRWYSVYVGEGSFSYDVFVGNTGVSGSGKQARYRVRVKKQAGYGACGKAFSLRTVTV